MSTPTPRTDAVIWPYMTFDGAELVPVDLARTLERELEYERERSRLFLAAMNERDDGYIESRKRMSALESALNAEREKVKALRLACERIVEQWDKNHDTNPIGAGGRMYSRASAALAATEDTKT